MSLLTYALDGSQALVHVDDVPKGLKCGCFCPHCGAKLYAKNGGTIREHHFAHEHGAECEGAYESSIHRLAKEILQSTGCIMLPESEDNSKPSGLVKIHNIEIEKWDDQYGIRPDAEGILDNGQRLLIEIFFSHKVDGKKRGIILDNNLLCIEIDINYQELDREELKRFLTDSIEDREWVKPKDAPVNPRGSGGYGRNPLYDKARDRLKEIFASKSLQMVSFTITEKGYALQKADGTWFPFVEADIKNGPDKATGAMAVLVAMLYERFKAGKYPIALVSMDNCSKNGAKLRESVLTMAEEWKKQGFVDDDFIKYVSDEKVVAFPWTMIDKITPRPSEQIAADLEKLGVEDMQPVITSKKTYIAPFVNAEKPQYLVIEDSFPNGRPALEKGFGVYMADRNTVNLSERMKVTV